MTASARALRLLAAACFLYFVHSPLGAAQAPQPLVVNAFAPDAADDDVVDFDDASAGNDTTQAAARASMGLIAAEAAAAMAAMAPNGSALAVEWEVWDPEEGDAPANRDGALGLGMGMAMAAGKAPVQWSQGDMAAVFPPEGSMPAWLMPAGLLATPAPTPAPAPALAAPLDALIDFALGAIAHELRANHSTEAPAPDFSHDFVAKMGFLKVRGHLEAMGGTVGDLSSLFRDGAATLRRGAGGALVLDAAAGLRSLRIKYRHYSARAGPIRVSGEIQVDASPVSVRAELWLVPPCRVQLRSLSVARVGRVKVRASGLGALKRLLPLLEKWMTKRMRAEIERSVLPPLEKSLNAQLQRLNC